ncbi:MAG TPA: methyltransferase [Polyangiaceae bacterium]|nr:methyltransferase [Polyangiaceae bacterium]
MAPPATPPADLFFGGALRLEQAPRGGGYRANVDAFLLARAALLDAPRAPRAVDLGAGAGAVGLSYALFSAAALTLVERDPLAAARARRNAAPFASARVLEADVERARARAELVLCNPPFTEPSSGRPSPDPARDAARRGALAPFLRAAARALDGPAARAFFVYPAGRLPELLQGAARAGLAAASLRFVHPRPGAPARVVLAAFAARGAGPARVLPPWFEWRGGARDPELEAFLAGEGDPALPRPG